MKNYECKQNLTIIHSLAFQKVFKEVVVVSRICEGAEESKFSKHHKNRAYISICHQNDYEKFPGMCKLTCQMKEKQSSGWFLSTKLNNFSCKKKNITLKLSFSDQHILRGVLKTNKRYILECWNTINQG